MAEPEGSESQIDLPSLPPIVPELWMEIGSPGTLVNRICNLVGQGYSVVLYAQENQLHRADRRKLCKEFRSECGQVLGSVCIICRSCVSFNPQERLDLYKDFQSLISDIEQLVEEYLSNNRIIPSGKLPAPFYELAFSTAKLLLRAGVMSNIQVDEFTKQAPIIVAKQVLRVLAKSEKEHKQPAKTDSDITAPTGWRVPWNDDDINYIPLKDAVNLANNDSITIKKMSGLLEDPKFPVHHMHKGRRCKVHLAEFKTWLGYAQSGKITDKAIEKHLKGIERRKEEAKQKTRKLAQLTDDR